MKLEFKADAAAEGARDALHRAVRPGSRRSEIHEEAQLKRVEKEKEQLDKNIANSKRQLSDDVFLSKAPPKVIESIRQKLAEYEAQLSKYD